MRSAFARTLTIILLLCIVAPRNPVNAQDYYAAGFRGNYIIIMPEQNMVNVSRWLEPSERTNFFHMILESLSL